MQLRAHAVAVRTAVAPRRAVPVQYRMCRRQDGSRMQLGLQSTSVHDTGRGRGAVRRGLGFDADFICTGEVYGKLTCLKPEPSSSSAQSSAPRRDDAGPRRSTRRGPWAPSHRDKPSAGHGGFAIFFLRSLYIILQRAAMLPAKRFAAGVAA